MPTELLDPYAFDLTDEARAILKDFEDASVPLQLSGSGYYRVTAPFRFVPADFPNINDYTGRKVGGGGCTPDLAIIDMKNQFAQRSGAFVARFAPDEETPARETQCPRFLGLQNEHICALPQP